jgi:tetratricopeptide (TPR) repeat protein
LSAASDRCPEDGELAAFVERTLPSEHRDRVERHLDDCATCRETIGHVSATGDVAPRTLGRYRLDRVIGSGGMGVVWQAWDPALERGLAIKLLRPEVTDANGRARMVREARALARLQHPNVIAIHDVGELGDDLFIATELIDGETMDRWQRGRPPAEVIAAYAQAARGLAAAHGLGLVHRDVKPSNILHGRDGRVRVGDFGLATRDSATAPTAPAHGPTTIVDPRLTVDGEVVGTPAYMAPEQRDGGSVDARADQYSLCLALAEALLGAQPRPDATAAELAASGVDAPWGAIARGLATRPADRHPDLAPLIAALGGEATPARRWRAPLVAAGAVVVAVAGTLVALRLAASDPAVACAGRQPLAGAWDPAMRRAITDAFHASKLAYGDDAAFGVIGAIDTWAREFTAEDRRACEDDANRRQAAEVIAKRRSCLSRLRQQVVALGERLTTQPDPRTIQRGPISARQLTAPATCNTPVGLADLTVPADPEAAARVDALSTRVTAARTLRHLGKLAEARTAAESVLADARATGFLPVIAEAQQELGTILHAQDDPGAEHALEDALAVAAQAHADYRTAAISALLVEIVGAKGDVAAAERQARLARPAIIRAGNDRNLEAVIERGLGATNMNAQKYAVAYDHYRRAEEIHTALGRTDDVDFDRRAQVNALGSVDRIDEATRINQQVLASDRANLGPKHPRTIADMTAGGMILFRSGRYAEAATALEAALVLEEEVSGRDSVRTATLRGRLGGVYMTMGRLAEAEPLFADVVRALSADAATEPAELAGQRMNLAGIRILLGRHAEARAELTALADAAREAGDNDFLGLVLQNLAETLTRDGKHAEALVAGREALELDIKVFGAKSRRAAEAHAILGNIYTGLGKPALATTEYRRAIELFETVIGKETPQLGDPLVGLAELHLARKDAAGAKPLLERAVAVLAGGDPVDLARARFTLARTHDALKDRAAALTAARAALELYSAAGERGATRRAEVEAWIGAR